MAGGPGLPGLGKHGGRMRNTFANALSKTQVDYTNPGGEAALPALDPASTANYYAQLGGLFAQYQQELLAAKQARVGARVAFRDQVAAIRADEVGGIRDAQASAIDRGVLGSSADLSARAGVRGAAESARQSALRERTAVVGQSRLAAQQAGLSYYQGAQQLESQKLAQQQSLLADQLAQNAIVSGQESQMNAMQAIFDALTASLSAGGGRKRKAAAVAGLSSFALNPANQGNGTNRGRAPAYYGGA